MSYRVKTVSSLTGIPRETLLAWERRYAILEPERTGSGHRRYSDADVAVLRRLKALVDQGYAISEAVGMARAARGRAPAPLPEALLEALAAFDRESADGHLPQIEALPHREALERVYLPLLRETGARWGDGRLTVAQEHFVSGWCREQLFAMLHQLGSGPIGGPTAVCALAPGELHELPLLAIALLLMLAGWRVTWLGADLPIADLAAYAARERPRLVCLSAVVAGTPRGIAQWARELRAAAPAETLIAFGGPGAEPARDVPGVEFCRGFEELEALLAAQADALRRRGPSGSA